MPETGKRFWLWLGLSALVILADQLSKQVVLNHLVYGQSIQVTAYFDLVLVYNPGAAFSFLASGSGWQRWFFIALALVICGWILRLLRRHQFELLHPLAFALIIGGALGNVIDRALYGAVVDFLYFHIAGYYWPAFNLADSAISVGVVLMLLAQWRAGATSQTTSETPP